MTLYRLLTSLIVSLSQTKEMNDSFRSTANKVKLAMETNPGSKEHPLRKQRSRVHQDYLRYVHGKDKIDRELRFVAALLCIITIFVCKFN